MAMVIPIDDPNRRSGQDVAFIVWAAIAVIGLIVVSYALGVAFDPDQALSIFAVP
jgi:hypothetical protein